MRTFDYIPKYDFKDTQKKDVMNRGPAPGEMWLLGQDRFRGFWNLVLLRYCPAMPMKDLTVDWCESIIQEINTLSGHNTTRLEIHPDDTHEVIYLPKEQCYRIFELDDDTAIPVLEQIGDEVCTDRSKMLKAGIHPYLANLNDLDDLFLNPSVNDDGSLGAPVFLNGWESLIPESAAKEAYTLAESMKSIRKKSSIYPSQADIFRALQITSPEKVKAVIIGQDPYADNAGCDGLAFSVKKGYPLPPALQNIFSVLNADLGCPIPESGSLTQWAENGVLLLNTVLTVEKEAPLSHAKLGWQNFTAAIIEACASLPQPVVFLLWGAEAVAFCRSSLDNKKDKYMLCSTHPAPTTVKKKSKLFPSFAETRPFSSANAWLSSKGETPIDWDLTHAPNEDASSILPSPIL